MKNKKQIGFILAILMMACGSAYAGEGTAGDYFTDMGVQIGRGLWNVVSSPAEIPCTMRDDIQAKGGATGTFTGFGKGLAFFVRRVVVGVCEVGTFVMPAPPALPNVCTKPETAAQPSVNK